MTRHARKTLLRTVREGRANAGGTSRANRQEQYLDGWREEAIAQQSVSGVMELFVHYEIYGYSPREN